MLTGPKMFSDILDIRCQGPLRTCTYFRHIASVRETMPSTNVCKAVAYAKSRKKALITGHVIMAVSTRNVTAAPAEAYVIRTAFKSAFCPDISFGRICLSIMNGFGRGEKEPRLSLPTA